MLSTFPLHQREDLTFALRPIRRQLVGRLQHQPLDTAALDQVRFEHFVDVRFKSDFEIAALLKENEIDIAVDLMGFSGYCRPGIFALRPAPMQVNYLGYPATMGADFIDYLLADAVLIPEEMRIHYHEKIVFLPDSYMPNDSKRRVAARPPTRAAPRAAARRRRCFPSPREPAPAE